MDEADHTKAHAAVSAELARLSASVELLTQNFESNKSLVDERIKWSVENAKYSLSLQFAIVAYVLANLFLFLLIAIVV